MISSTLFPTDLRIYKSPTPLKWNSPLISEIRKFWGANTLLNIFSVSSCFIVATLGISVLASPYSNPVHSSHSYHSHSDFHFTQPASPLSLARFPENSGQLERGRVGQCASALPEPNGKDVQLMSKNPTVVSDDVPRAENRSPADEGKTQTAPGLGSSTHSDEQDPVRSRSVSLHPSVPVEPPLEPQLRSIGVHSILNPPANVAADFTASSTGEGQLSHSPGLPGPRQTSSPLDHSAHLGRRPSLSPGTGQRHILTPVSPSTRLVGGMSRNLPRTGSLSALHSPLGLEPRGVMQSTSGLPVLPDPAGQSSIARTQPRTSVSLHSTPTFHNRRISGGPANPSSHETSPQTPHATHGQFASSSPAVVNAPPLHASQPLMGSSAYRTMDPLPRPPTTVGPRQDSLPHGKIPVFMDYKSGSSIQAAKRKANSEASKRFRNRQKVEEQMEKTVTAQQEEIKKQIETIRRQEAEIRSLIQERDYYRSERDFYREEVGRNMPLAQMPARPPSPRSMRVSFETPEHAIEARPPVSNTGQAGQLAGAGPSAVIPVGSVQQNWPTAQPYSAPSSYPEPVIASGDQPARSLPPLAGTWANNPGTQR